MVFITDEEILETVRMIQDENLDVRAVTMGISLNDCASRDVGRVCRARPRQDRRPRRPPGARGPRDRRRNTASRSSTAACRSRPSPTWSAAGDPTAYVEVAHALDAAAAEIGIDFVGGFSALVQKGFTRPRRRPDRGHPAGHRRDAARVLVGQRGLHARRHQHGRRDAHGRRAARRLATHRRPRLHRLRQDRHLLQRARGQPLHGRRPARQRRARDEHQRGHLGTGRDSQRGRPPPRPARSPTWPTSSSARPSRSPASASSWRARRPQMLDAADGHHRPLAGALAGDRRLGGRDPRGHGPGAHRRARHHRGAGHAERRRQEGRHHGDLVDRRPLGRLHPGERRRRHGARRRRRRAQHREARGHDRRLLARAST